MMIADILSRAAGPQPMRPSRERNHEPTITIASATKSSELAETPFICITLLSIVCVVDAKAFLSSFSGLVQLMLILDLVAPDPKAQRGYTCAKYFIEEIREKNRIVLF